MEFIAGIIILLAAMAIIVSVMVRIARTRRLFKKYHMNERRNKWRYK